MEHKQLEERMKDHEIFRKLSVEEGSFIVLRMDGRGFSGLSRRLNIERPFSERMHEAMVQATEKAVVELGGIYGYTQSDEISILLPADSEFFGRRIEKLVSLSAAIATATFNKVMGTAAAFDSRIVVLPIFEDVVDYFWWRMADATRCSINGTAYWFLRQEKGLSARGATKELHEKNALEKVYGLAVQGVDWHALDPRQKYGSGVAYEFFIKQAHNMITSDLVEAPRRKLVRLCELAGTYEGCKELLAKLAEEYETWKKYKKGGVPPEVSENATVYVPKLQWGSPGRTDSCRGF